MKHGYVHSSTLGKHLPKEEDHNFAFPCCTKCSTHWELQLLRLLNLEVIYYMLTPRDSVKFSSDNYHLLWTQFWKNLIWQREIIKIV